MRAAAAVVARAEVSNGLIENPRRNFQEEDCRHQNGVTKFVVSSVTKRGGPSVTVLEGNFTILYYCST